MENMEMVTKFLRLSSNYGATTLSSLSPHVAFQLVKKKSSLGVTVVFLVYMDKLVCSNSDSNQEAIREQ